jgi:energy-converting hydrogenase Eha subunit B
MASTLVRERVALRKLIWLAPLTLVTTAIVNLIIRTIAVASFGVAESFQYLQAGLVIGTSLVYGLLALLAFWLVSRFARRPIQFYRIVALVALVVSYLFPILALVGAFPLAGMTPAIFWTMLLMHTASALVIVGLLTTLARESTAQP